MIQITDNLVNQTIIGLGNKENIKNIDCCITRLRVQLYNFEKRENNDFFTKLGFVSIVNSEDELQLALGSQVYELKEKIILALKL